MEDLILPLDGVIDTAVGYTGGSVEEPTHDIVKAGRSGHAEVVQISGELY